VTWVQRLLGAGLGVVCLGVVGVGTFGSAAVSGRCVTYPPLLASGPDVQICGLVLAHYLDIGGPNSSLGRPVESESGTPPAQAQWGDRVTSFAYGGIYRNTRSGAVRVVVSYAPLSSPGQP